MKEPQKETKADLHDHHDRLPKDVQNNAQVPDSFRDPLEVQKEKENKMQPAQGRNEEGTDGRENS